MIRKHRVVAVAIAIALAVAACGGDDDAGSASSSAAAQSSSESTSSPVRTEPAGSAPSTGTGTSDATTIDGTNAGATGTHVEAPKERTPELLLGLGTDPSPIDPVQLLTPVDRIVASAVFEPLVELSEDGQFVPALATSWESADAKTWTVKLREGVTFSDGEPFDADAVVANYDRAKDPARNPRPANTSTIESVTAVDSHTVEFVLTQPLGSFPAFLNETYSNMVSPAVLARTNDVGSNPVGTGPFVLEQRSADSISFTRNPTYWGASQPYSDRIVFRIIPDTQSLFAALQAGDIDLITKTDDTTNAQAEGVDGIQVIRTPGLGTMHIFLNTTKPPFDDVRARLALAHATDREAYVAFTNTDGQGEIVDGPWPSGMPVTGAAHTDKWPAYDVEAARALVDEIGGLSFTMLTYNAGGYPLQAQLLQDMWADAGIKMEIKLADAQTVVADAGNRNLTALLSAWSGRPDPDLNAFRYLHSSSTTSPSGIADDVLDDLIVRARATTDEAERKDLYQQLVDRLAEIMPIVYLEGLRNSVVTSTSVKGVVVPPDGNIRLQYLYKEEK